MVLAVCADASSRRAAWGLLAAFVLYGLLAYSSRPEYWWLRDRHDVTLPGEMVTTTTDRIAGDPINVGFIGSKAELIHAFTVAGWHPADTITWRSSLEIGDSVIFDRPYGDAPVSALCSRAASRISPSKSRSAKAPTAAITSGSGDARHR